MRELFQHFISYKLSLILVVILVNCAHAAIPEESSSVKADASMYFNGVESDQEEARVLGVELNFQLKQKIDSELSMELDGGPFFESGSYNSTLSLDEYAPRSDIKVNQAQLVWKPFAVTDLRAGLLNQSWMESPLLLGRVAFPTAYQQLYLYRGNLNFQIYMIYTQSIPNNRNLSNRMGEISEGTPSLMTESLGVKMWGEQLKFKMHLSHFNFSNLSHATASKSQFLGNSVFGLAGNAEYLYSFKGYNLMSKLEHPLTSEWKAVWHGEYLYNSQAPNGRNSGYMGSLGLQDKKFMLQLGYYYNESDSSPAYYNDGKLGHNNMKGVLTALSFFQLKPNFDLHLKYFLRQKIKASSYQSDGGMITLTMVRHYDF
ncbi:MAG: hypothetical protein HN730_05260 [Bdellovibrionales bacterium]|nr:hypothetical protein [Bdellovibrionales bacterium]